MANIIFNCSYCQQRIEAPEEMIGESAECPTCQQVIQITNKIPESAKRTNVIPEDFFDTTNKYPEKCSRDCSGEVLLKEIQCRNCGAQVAFDVSNLVIKCAFCGSEYVVEPTLLKPVTLDVPKTQIVPVAIDAQKANDIFLQWLADGFWKPDDLDRAFKKDGATMVYMPFWALNADVYTTWNGSYSQTHYRTVTKTRSVTNSQGHMVQENYTDSEPYQVWFQQNGDHSANYWDFISASDALTQTEADKLNFDGAAFKPLRNDYLHGWQSAKLLLSKKQALEASQQRMIDWEGSACRKLIESLKNWRCQFSFRDCYVVYMPIWTFAYTYGDKSFRAIINGKTGEIFGDKPISKTKVAIAIVLGVLLALVLFAVLAQIGKQ